MLAKVEYLNPGGSVKDRIATRMIDAAEASGELQPGGTIVEPTSGNTGVGLAMVAQQRGYKCVFVCPDKVSEDKRNVLKAYGAEVVVCPTAVAPEHPDSYYNVSDRLVLAAGRLEARPVLQPAQPALALRDHRPGDLGADRGPDHPLRDRHGHRRHDQRRRPLPQGAEPGRSRSSAPTRPARSTPAAPAGPTSSRASARTSGPRPTTARSPTGSSRSPTPTRSPSPAGWPARRRCWSAARPAWRRTPRASWPTSWPRAGPDRRRDRRAAARLRPRLPDQGLQRRLAGAVRLPDRRRPRPAPRPSARCCAARTAGCPTWCTPTPARPSPRRSRSCRSTPSRRCPSSAPSRRSWPPRWPARSPTGPCSTRCSPAPPGSPTGSRTTCRPPLPTIGSTEDARDAVALLESADAVLVQEDGKPVGVLTRQDLLAFLAVGPDLTCHKIHRVPGETDASRTKLHAGSARFTGYPVKLPRDRPRMRTRSSFARRDERETSGRGVVHHRAGADAARVAVHDVRDGLLPADRRATGRRSAATRPATARSSRPPSCPGAARCGATPTRSTSRRRRTSRAPTPTSRSRWRRSSWPRGSRCSARSPTATASRTCAVGAEVELVVEPLDDELLVWRWKPASVTELGEEADQ